MASTLSYEDFVAKLKVCHESFYPRFVTIFTLIDAVQESPDFDKVPELHLHLFHEQQIKRAKEREEHKALQEARC